MNYNWNWAIYLEAMPGTSGTYLAMLLEGLRWTVATAICAWLLAFIAGSLVGVARSTGIRALVLCGNAYIEVFRNIPLLVQLFLWYFVAPELLPQQWAGWLKQQHDAAFYIAVLGIGLYMSARVATQVTAGIQSLPAGQRMAGLAMGLTTAQVYRHVLLPMAYRIVLPPLTSEFLNTIKNTSVALTIGLVELTARAHAMQEFSFQVFEAFIGAALLYLLLNAAATTAMRMLERRLAVPGYLSGR